MVLVHVYAVMMLTTSQTTTARVLSVLSNTTMTCRHMSTLLSILLQSGSLRRLVIALNGAMGFQRSRASIKRKLQSRNHRVVISLPFLIQEMKKISVLFWVRADPSRAIIVSARTIGNCVVRLVLSVYNDQRISKGVLCHCAIN
jgi:hypothetical protein